MAVRGEEASKTGRLVDFEKDVRPLLEDRCYSCHGPERQRGDLRFDLRSVAIKGGSHGPAWVPGDSAGSLMIQFVMGNPEDMRMPEKGEALSSDEIALLRDWVDQGANWPDSGDEVDPIRSHWAFQPVKRDGNEGRTLDEFIEAKLGNVGLEMSVEADRRTLIRRMYLVMLGMPPEPAEVDAFIADTKPDAYERLVDRVLEDERLGERWARHWLDVVRFAETNGFETNRERLSAWRFRDYVIRSFNEDKPFDQFIREQLAGDVLGVDVATGFLVGGPVDIVGSPDPVLTSNQRADVLDDMVNTTGTAFLGLTLGCARCHTHKFDPITHTEYHSLVAMVAGVRHGEKSIPLEPEIQAKLDQVRESIAGLRAKLKRFEVGEDKEVVKSGLRPPVNAVQNLEEFDPVMARAVRFVIRKSSGGSPGIDELEVWSEDRNVALASEGSVASASGTLQGYPIHQLEHVNDGKVGNSWSWISDEIGRGWVQVSFGEPAKIQKIVWGRDREGNFGDRVATEYEIQIEDVDGAWATIASSKDREPFKEAGTKPKGPEYRFDGIAEAEAAQGRQWIAEVAALEQQRNNLMQQPTVYAGNFQDPGPVHRFHRGDPMQKREVVAPGTLAIFEPFQLDGKATDKDRRLRLAEWIAHEGNPLTARVLANRIWQHHFGTGIVDTPNDFGKNGGKPTHPELLDWLADQLMDEGWSLKHLHRTILLSATWRQSSAPKPAGLNVDASSRLLWRFPPRRLEAEAIRDSILHVSGALNDEMGGPSFYLHDVDRENVYHYHPKEKFGPSDMRRMVYAFKVRMEPDSVFGAFDCPDGSLVVPRRNLSTTALQALNLFNSQFLLDQVDHLTQRVSAEAGPDVKSQLRRVWRLTFGREPDSSELAAAGELTREHGLLAVCRAVLNSNEFLFLP